MCTYHYFRTSYRVKNKLWLSTWILHIPTYRYIGKLSKWFRAIKPGLQLRRLFYRLIGRKFISHTIYQKSVPKVASCSTV